MSLKRAIILFVAALSASSACKPARPALSSPFASPAADGPRAAQLVVQNGSGPVVELRFVIEAGSRDDPKGREGLSHVMLTSMLEGRAAGIGYAERARLLYPMAAALSGYVGREQTVLVARVHRDHFAAFYPLLRGVLLAPAFDPADVDRVRTRTLSSLTQDLRGADDEELGKQTLQAMLYEGEPRENPEIGTELGLSAIRAQDVSAQWGRLLCARRMSVAVSGPLSETQLSTLRDDLASLERPACSAEASGGASQAAAGPRVWIIDKPEAQSVAISIGFAIDVTRDHPDHAALTLAAAYLGQHRTFAGRLMQAMREQRGLNYGDYAYAEHFEQDGDSRFPLPNVARRGQYFSVWVRPVRAEQAHFALRMALYELGRFFERGLDEADFARIQRFAQRYYALYAQTEQQRLGYALDDVFYGRGAPPYLDGLRAAFGALTRAQLNAAVARHLSLEHVQIAIVAPQAEGLAAALVEDTPSPISYSSEKSAELLEEDARIAAHPLRISREQIRILPVAEIFK